MNDVPHCLRRKDHPILFVEQLAMADWLREGWSVPDISRRVQRPIPQTRQILFG